MPCNKHALCNCESEARMTALTSPAASPAVLFHMMNYYKRRAEALEMDNIALKKRMRTQYEEFRNEMGDLQQQLHDAAQTNHELAQVNLRGAETIVRKHNAGLRLAHCFDELSAAIELVEDTHVGDEAMGLRYISMKKNEIMGRADSAVQMLANHEIRQVESELERWENEVADNLLVMQHGIIDLTADTDDEETETEEEEEDEEDNNEVEL